jgi:hypothetical protein
MKLDSLPDTIQAIVLQAGRLGVRGAFVYVGAHNLTYRCPEPVGEYRSSHPSRLTSEAAWDFGVRGRPDCRVNGKRGQLKPAPVPDPSRRAAACAGLPELMPLPMSDPCRSRSLALGQMQLA